MSQRLGKTIHDQVRAIESILVVSPHFDDGVFSCGNVIAAHPGTTVVTAFAGAPQAARALSTWDERCGFSDIRQAWQTRRQEDAAALALLSAHPLHLDFADSQYGDTASVEALSTQLERQIDRMRPQAVLLPLGLFHADHILTHEACLLARRQELVYIAYEDALYRQVAGLVQERLSQLLTLGIGATPVAPHAAEGSLKREAVECYASQLRGFGPSGYGDLELPERYWALDFERQQLRGATAEPAR